MHQSTFVTLLVPKSTLYSVLQALSCGIISLYAAQVLYTIDTRLDMYI